MSIDRTLQPPAIGVAAEPGAALDRLVQAGCDAAIMVTAPAAVLGEVVHVFLQRDDDAQVKEAAAHYDHFAEHFKKLGIAKQQYLQRFAKSPRARTAATSSTNK